MPADEFLAVQRDIADAQPRRRSHPTGWEPGVDTAARTLTVVSEATSPPTDWSDIIRELGLDPTAWTVDDTQPCQVRSWDSGDKRMFYYRAAISPIGEKSSVDVEQLVREIKRRKPKLERPTGDHALVVALADWQAGKPEAGGVEALVERLLSLRDELPRHAKRLRRSGIDIGSLYVTTMGDLVEGCDGHYAQQTFGVELDRRQQVKLVRRMLVEMLTEWSRHFERVVVSTVPGNHGENRRDGRSFTTFEDNDDLATVEQASEILAANREAFDHVRFVIPDGDMTVTLDIAGTVVAFAHGHQARGGGGTPQAKLDKWWKGKQHAQHPVGDASILVTGHYHHLVVVEDGPRTWFQCPANDGGSRWWEEGGGAPTRCGTLTFVVGENGWSNMEVLR